MATREYRVTRFTSIYTDNSGLTWHVYNDVAGHPVWSNPDADCPQPRAYATYGAAKTEALEMGNFYRSVERGNI